MIRLLAKDEPFVSLRTPARVAFPGRLLSAPLSNSRFLVLGLLALATSFTRSLASAASAALASSTRRYPRDLPPGISLYEGPRNEVPE